MAKPKSVKETLQQVKQTLNKYGWIKGSYGDTEQGFCLIGALKHVDGRYEFEATELVKEVCVKRGGCWVAEYNDAKSRRKADIMSVLDQAIKLADTKKK